MLMLRDFNVVTPEAMVIVNPVVSLSIKNLPPASIYVAILILEVVPLIILSNLEYTCSRIDSSDSNCNQSSCRNGDNIHNTQRSSSDIATS